MSLSERDKSILDAIIREYIATGEPVGSRVVARKYMVTISPATVRNVMADLEELGLLYQPHVSAGRIPTPEGFRFYLAEIMEPQELAGGERSLINRQLTRTRGNFRQSLQEASSLLSEISHNAAIVILPKVHAIYFRRVDFVRLDERRILVILVSRSGMVYNHVVHAGEDMTQDELTRYSNYLNESCGELTIRQMRDKLICQMENDKAHFDHMVSQALVLGVQAIDGMEDTPDIVIEGKNTVFNAAGLTDMERLKGVVNAFEDKGRIVRILNRVLTLPGVNVMLGNEMSEIGMGDFSMIASGYYQGDVPVGSLGVIGPMRMDYSRVIPLVDYMAKVLSNVLEEL